MRLIPKLWKKLRPKHSKKQTSLNLKPTTCKLLAKVSLFCDQRIGEILRELPTKQGKRTDTTSVRMETEVTKSEAIKNAGIAHQQAIDLQKIAANPEVVEAVIAKAEAGRKSNEVDVPTQLTKGEADPRYLKKAAAGTSP